ncbi:hypothetical protein Ljor_1996 [Legionella jordanis]|uniref:Uncharacterized protein n=1 Tax=Legionella jordanis TaxID=456 RepID=A0A0W0VC62_9GAMM|nr:hypothetical protein Ljor_1996 [Legionella jordanis]VEH11378.1 Uncharacterised protein [Legionella jordanis]
MRSSSVRQHDQNAFNNSRMHAFQVQKLKFQRSEMSSPALAVYLLFNLVGEMQLMTL